MINKAHGFPQTKRITVLLKCLTTEENNGVEIIIDGTIFVEVIYIISFEADKKTPSMEFSRFTNIL